MNFLIVVLTGIFITLFSANTVYTATLSSPTESAIVHAGEQFQVRLDLLPDEQVKEVALLAWQSSQMVVLTSPPFEAVFTAAKKEMGEDRIEAIITFTNGKILKLSKNINIILPDGVTLQEITYFNKHAFIIDTDNEKKIESLSGIYSDGIKRDLPNIANPILEFSSDDSSIVEVDNTGKMTSKKVGETFITIKSGNVSFKLPVRIFVSLEPPQNLKITPTQTQFALTWDLSPNDPKWITDYKVYRTERPDGLYDTLIATVPKGSTTFTDTTALPGKTYYYSVQAISTTANDVSNLTDWKSGKLTETIRQ